MNQRLSSLKDSELDEDEVERLLDAVKHQPQVRDQWNLYGLVGDALRQEPALAFDIADRVMAQLEDEPTVLAPVTRQSPTSQRIRWALPLAASFMGVAAVAWVAQSVGPAGGGALALRNSAGGSVPAVTAVQTPAVSAPTPVAVAPANAAPAAAQREVLAVAPPAAVSERFEREYLLAHQAIASSPSMSGAVQYVRTVSEARDEPEQ